MKPSMQEVMAIPLQRGTVMNELPLQSPEFGVSPSKAKCFLLVSRPYKKGCTFLSNGGSALAILHCFGKKTQKASG